MVHPWHRLTCNHITAISASILTGHPSGAMLFFSLSVMSNSSATPKDCSPTWFLCPWDFPGKNTEIGCHFLLRGIFLTKGSNPRLLHWQVDSLWLSHLGSHSCYLSNCIYAIFSPSPLAEDILEVPGKWQVLWEYEQLRKTLRSIGMSLSEAKLHS